MGLSEEGATADGGESGCAGAGGVEKGGLLAALQAEGLRRRREAVPRRLKAEGKVSSLVALYPSSFECPAFMMKKLCLEKWYKAVGRGRRRALRLGRLKVEFVT